MAKQRQRLSRDTIVGCAVTLADAEGLDAVTIRRLAQENGVTPMAMYWHFNDKESLLDALAEHLLDNVVLPEPTDEPWDVQLRAILAAILAALRPHPAFAGLAMRRVLAAESGLLLAERTLGLLAEAGLEPRRAAEVATFLLCSVITLVASDPEGVAEPSEEKLRRKQADMQALSPARYPHVIAAAPDLVECRSGEGFFTHNLDLLVHGVRASR
ncbi:TetR/AcrR family transcriptional regulator C-terminal domain-containing protein [Symbioplanes lichenis]|uniref:TetR/AcrR family transcriptional regulator C-terminal domain-containing protein n=1 Tax=Symbioplanes lichenis TaxID=1629072 RepID=UPI002738E620|nr:TetR/AcrR family transcriptional regulator C-terminal domain-containing protein [Actinoplanes lichenis]